MSNSLHLTSSGRPTTRIFPYRSLLKYSVSIRTLSICIYSHSGLIHIGIKLSWEEFGLKSLRVPKRLRWCVFLLTRLTFHCSEKFVNTHLRNQNVYNVFGYWYTCVTNREKVPEPFPGHTYTRDVKFEVVEVSSR